jgi:anthranilate/para-aminobenzoate synthase component I
MGAIGYYAPPSWNSGLATFDLSVAIRTMVVSDRRATFNVGGGIVIDSEPEKEWDETITKSQALMSAIGGRPA